MSFSSPYFFIAFSTTSSAILRARFARTFWIASSTARMRWILVWFVTDRVESNGFSKLGFVIFKNLHVTRLASNLRSTRRLGGALCLQWLLGRAGGR